MKEFLFNILCILIAASIILTVQVNTGVDVPGATKVLKTNGYKPLEVGGFGYFQSGHDWYSTKFKAISVSGDTVTGVVTKGLFLKSSSIRFDD